VFQDGSCECPKLDHRRLRRAQSETHGCDNNFDAQKSALGQNSCDIYVEQFASGRTRMNACAFRRNTVRQPAGGTATVQQPKRQLDSRTELRPTSNGSRCITKGEVHAVRERRRTRPVSHVYREATRNIEARARTPRNDDESPRSFIRVSQVYP
jgi:hypothetical protein